MSSSPRTSAAQTEQAQQPHWHFDGHRKASVPASEAGQVAQHTTNDERDEFIKLTQQTRGMTPTETAEYLKQNAPRPNGDVIMSGRGLGKDWQGYGQLCGAYRGTM